MKGLRENAELPMTLHGCVCPQKNERQQNKPITHGIRNSKKIKNKKLGMP